MPGVGWRDEAVGRVLGVWVVPVRVAGTVTDEAGDGVVAGTGRPIGALGPVRRAR